METLEVRRVGKLPRPLILAAGRLRGKPAFPNLFHKLFFMFNRAVLVKPSHNV